MTAKLTEGPVIHTEQARCPTGDVPHSCIVPRSFAHDRCAKPVLTAQPVDGPFEGDLWDQLKEDAFESKPKATEKAGTRDSQILQLYS